MITSWKKRFTEYYKKYTNLQKALEIPMGEEFIINAETRAKFTQQIMKDGKSAMTTFTSGLCKTLLLKSF